MILLTILLILIFALYRVYQNLAEPKHTHWKRATLERQDEAAFNSFKDNFIGYCDKQPEHATYEQSAKTVSDLVSSGSFLTVDDLIRSNAKKLFWAHRHCAADIEGGLSVRVTVQYNLFGGTVANLGSDQQRSWLSEVFQKGELGCFLLTESGAGVLSGLIVETTAQWNGDGFTLQSPDPTSSSRKCWISQGLTARWGVVFARLLLGQEDKGPHAFIVDMEAEGVSRSDMTPKTDFNSLDNAFVEFQGTKIARENMLSRFSFVDESGKYCLTDPNQPFSFVTVAQRLLSGRICIAGASLSHLQKALKKVEKFGKRREIPIGVNETTPLSSLPIMRDLLSRQRTILHVFTTYIAHLEQQFMTVDTIDARLVDRIACAKIETIKFAIDSLYQLKSGVGSLSLLENGPFGSKNDILYVFKFAEGDSAILQQKMARDAVKQLASPVKLLKEFVNVPLALFINSNNVGLFRAQTSLALIKLALRMKGVSRAQMARVWLEAHALVTDVARKKALLTIFDTVSSDLRGTKELEYFRQYIYSSQ